MAAGQPRVVEHQQQHGRAQGRDQGPAPPGRDGQQGDRPAGRGPQHARLRPAHHHERQRQGRPAQGGDPQREPEPGCQPAPLGLLRAGRGPNEQEQHHGQVGSGDGQQVQQVGGPEGLVQIGRNPGRVPDDQSRQQGPGIRCEPLGGLAQPGPQPPREPLDGVRAAVTRGGVSPAGRSSATARSPPRAGASRATTTTRVDGCSRAHCACPASTRTGVSTRVLAPSGPVTRVTTASRTVTGGPLPLRAALGSEPTVSSASTRACSRASPATGPARASARWSPATPAPADAHSRTAAAAGASRQSRPGRRHPHSISRPAQATPSPTPRAVRPTGASRARAAAAQADTAGTARRRSTGPAPSGPFTAAPACAGRRSAAPRCRRPGEAPPRSGSRRGPYGSRRCAVPAPARPPAGRPAGRPWPSRD